MKYPKPYSKKALDVLASHYFIDDEIQNTALLTLAAHCIDLVAESSEGVLTFEMVKETVQKPESTIP